jgi:hypothetical protein
MFGKANPSLTEISLSEYTTWERTSNSSSWRMSGEALEEEEESSDDSDD